MKAQLLQTEARSKRIKIKIPYEAVEWRVEIKKIQGIWYHKQQKLWSVPNILANLDRLKLIFGQDGEIIMTDGRKKLPTFEMTPDIAKKVEAMHMKLILSAKSENTVRAYRSHALRFFKHFENDDIATLSKETIEKYIYKLKIEHKIGDSLQNVIINAIKFYLEQVLGLPRAKYDITRPKKSSTLPGTLSEADCFKIINVLDNIKHKAILHLLYSAGIRREEVTKLRIEDIRSHEMMIFVKGGKGKKDRTTVLSEATLSLLREYVVECKPSYWLFEGQTGSRYSASSVAKIFRKAAKAAEVAEWSTPHTLRHSFATHLLQANVNLRFIQSCLGHESPETTQIYTHIVSVNNNVVRSPLDRIIDKMKNVEAYEEKEEKT
jgi:integrase/recombinase XerD